MTNETPTTSLISLSDDEVEFLSSIEGKNRHVSRALARKHGYTWPQIQDMRRRYLASIAQSDSQL